MKNALFIGLFFLLCSSASYKGYGQNNVFAALRNSVELADQYYNEGNYHEAWQLLCEVSSKKIVAPGVWLRVARCAFKLKEYQPAVDAFRKSEQGNGKFSDADFYTYAEALSSLEDYDHAIEYYRRYLALHPDDVLVQKKIWRLNNLNYLFEDSTHYALRSIAINTAAGELNAIPTDSGILFMSNRQSGKIIERVDASSNNPFYKLYFATARYDSVRQGIAYGAPTILQTNVDTKFHVGPAAVFENATKMVFASSGNTSSVDGKSQLKIFFAEKQNEEWIITTPFPFNNNRYSVTDPAISADGKVLYFSSNKNGGYGGYDIYKSEYVNGAWTEPANLGESINTKYDDVSPFLHENGTLYFSSDGHAGLGGLDIFKCAPSADDFAEPENVGYPLNSSKDDFGIYVNALQNFGYLSSNRKRGGFDDDVYEFDMDLQTYPLTISGVIKFKELTLQDSAQLRPLTLSKLYLIDILRKVTVYESETDANGNFSLIIPYFSKYAIRVVSPEGDEHKASLEIEKYRRETGQYEIVVVKEIF